MLIMYNDLDINLLEKLKGVPEGTPFYHFTWGELLFSGIDEERGLIKFDTHQFRREPYLIVDKHGSEYIYRSDGGFSPFGSCCIFPDEDCEKSSWIDWDYNDYCEAGTLFDYVIDGVVHKLIKLTDYKINNYFMDIDSHDIYQLMMMDKSKLSKDPEEWKFSDPATIERMIKNLDSSRLAKFIADLMTNGIISFIPSDFNSNGLTIRCANSTDITLMISK